MVTAASPECNVLLTSTGRRVAVTRAFQGALRDLGVPGKVVCVDLSKTAPALHVADAFELVPRVTSPTYMDALRDVCIRHRIGILVPLIDTELPVLARHRDSFQDIGVRALVSSPEVISICFDKRRTRDFFLSIGEPTPEILEPSEAIGRGRFPLFVKPAEGSASVGARRVNDARELEFFVEHTPNPVVQELVTGEEFTLDVLVDFGGQVRCVVPRLRIETRAGEISKGITTKDRDLIDCGRRVVTALPGPIGCITLQCFREPSGRLVCIEINPRFGGGFPLAHAAGADYPRWLIEWTLGRDPDVRLDGWTDGHVMLRFDDAVFVNKQDIS